jgi:hypothetical protein
LHVQCIYYNLSYPPRLHAQVFRFEGIKESRSTSPCSWRSLALTGNQDILTLAQLPLHSLCESLTLPKLTYEAYNDRELEDPYCWYTGQQVDVEVSM